MKKNRFMLILGLLLIAALALTACTATSGDVQQAIEEVAPTLQAAATELAPTVQAAVEEIAPTVEAVATEMAPAAEEAAPAFEPMSLAAPDCEYGGLFKEIAALDELTVQFTMCAPDPAFPSKVAFTSFAIQPSEWLESTGGTGELLEHPVGTGPYMISAWKSWRRSSVHQEPQLLGQSGSRRKPGVPLASRVGCAPARVAIRHG